MIRVSRLLPRIYIVSVLQLLAIVGGLMLVGYLTFNPERGPEFERRGRYVADTLSHVAADPQALARELARAERQMRLAVSVYAADGALLGSNVQPPLAAPASEHKRHGPRPPSPLGLFRTPPELILRLPISSSQLPGAYMVYRPPPPPSAPGLWIISISLVATAIASILLARSFARPLSQLAAAAKRFGAGDLQARAGLSRGDEFGELSQAFDEMAERVMQLVRSRQELLANVSHELRTPLARIRVALDLASEDHADAELTRDALLEITEDCAELERLVSDVLQTARLELSAGSAQIAQQPLHLERLDLATLIGRLVERFHSDHPTRTLELRCADRLPELYADPVLLRRALYNLLDNAQKYSPESAPVGLSVQLTAGQLEIAVEDKGIGIAAEDLAQVGTPFFRTDRSRTRRTGGIGLGLSLARKIVEAHGGKLVLESRLDHGTCARLRLPLTAAPEVQSV